MGNIFGFGKLLKSFGIEIKDLQKVFKDKEYGEYLLKLKDGKTATYSVDRMGGYLAQTVETPNLKVTYNTYRNPGYYGVGVRDSARNFIELPDIKSIGLVRDKNNAKILFASNYKSTPVGSEFGRTGRYKVNVLQELHSDRYVGPSVLPKDKLVSPDGVLRPIYQRPMRLSRTFDSSILRI